MPNACAVRKCKTGYRSLQQKCSVFKVPRNIEQFKKWQAAIPGVILKQSQYVCEKHFDKNCIIRQWIKRDGNGEIIAQTAYERPRLVETAVPTIFEDGKAVQSAAPACSECEDKPMEYILDTAQSSKQPDVTPLEQVQQDQDSQLVIIPPQDAMEVEIMSPNAIVERKKLQAKEANITDCSTVPPRSRNFGISDILVNDGNTVVSSGTEGSITIPKFWGCTELVRERGQSIVFSHLESKRVNGEEIPVIERSVMVDPDNRLRYSLCGQAVDPKECKLAEVLEETSLLAETLEKFRRMRACGGLGAVKVHYLPADTVLKDCLDRWRDNNCTLLSKPKKGEGCKKMRQRILRREVRAKENRTVKRVLRASNPIGERKLLALRKRSDRERRLKNRAKQRVQLLLQSLREKSEEIASISAKTLEKRCSALKSQLSEAQKAVLTEIISAASKKSTKNHRYSEEWIMLCILMNIRSPGYNEFLRKNNVLPLPCKRTIRSYFLLINMKCGFDKQFGQLMKKHFDTKSELQRHGILLLDEINLRKAVTVCSKNLTYVGLTDFGDDGPQSKNIEDLATHGLVIMFQALADSFTQPVAVFVSKNPANGDELAKLVVKAISFMENSGAKIHGVIGDGASTNAKMRSQLCVSGQMENTKTWFTHPLDDDRKVFVFSDMPRVYKCIRNRLYNKRKLRMNSSDDPICWEFFKVLYDLDTVHAGNARACPKITKRHVILDNTSKMRVRLAIQIFSDSVAKGLASYSSHKHPSLAGCEETIKFCSWMNAMFDALNRKTPNQGLTPENEDFKVLEDSLQSLNDWESSMERGQITADEFLTPETSKGLRMSLQSSMDMCRYLIEKFDFRYLLTGKVNQDNLEKFFGTIRQAAGCNDHPHSSTFLQLYKVLSLYSVIKPPKFGNCTISEESTPHILVSLREIREIYSNKSETKMAKYRREIREKLDNVLRHDDWEADDVIEHNLDHDYTLSPTLDCIIYYVTGLLF